MGQPKHALRVPDGPRLLDMAHAVLREAGIVHGVTLGDVPGVPGAPMARVPHVPDRAVGQGPLVALAHLATAGVWPGPRPTCIVVLPCDMPGVTPALVHAVKDAPPADVLSCTPVVPGQEGRARRGFPLRLTWNGLEAAAALVARGEARLGALLHAPGAHVLAMPGAALTNVNTPAEWEAWRSTASAARESAKNRGETA